MATWLYTNAVTILRVIINDNTSTDADLKKVLAISAFYVIQDIEFDTTYTVDITNLDISPDPSADTIFTAFMVMKAACQVDFNTYRTRALMDGITARCGPAALSVLGNLRGFKELLTIGPCSTYEAMKNDYVLGGGRICKAILSPFIGNSFNPESLGVASSNGEDTYYD